MRRSLRSLLDLGHIWSLAGWMAVLSLAGLVPFVFAADAIPVAVSILPEKYFVERVGGAHTDVSVIVSLGRSPVSYEPSCGQMAALKGASVYFRIGVPFESAWMGRMRSVNHYMLIVNLAEEIQQRAIEPIGGEELGREESIPDPHVWASPPLAKRVAERIRDTLVSLDPANQGDYERNYMGLAAELDELDAEIRDRLVRLKQRVFVTSHPAWGYFADTYGLRQIPIERSEKEPDPRALPRIIDEAKRQGIKVIFVEPQFSRSSAEQVAREIGGRVVEIDPLAEDYVANMRKVAAAFAKGLEAR